TTIPYKPAPVVAEFSSRGPHTISPDIIKPDVTAPGVEILAAWPINIPDTDNGKEVFVEYTFLSGTSMACPHVSGTIAYLKSIHPTWSPAAIKSAVMTTGNTNKAATVFNIGNGEIQPVKAVNPGLFYDTDPLDYITYLCNSGYTSKQIQNITGDSSSKCPKNNTSFSLNYPSITVLLDGNIILNIYNSNLKI
ncbi:subtilisin-like protease SBT4.8, partial [Selaginella moellendorffii]|uniref:subtilisin-like protease SBT4.8 n=1 Tax=Selaginella moellendorffii TaxID=88036 RepID=UPI000D1C4BBA